MQMADASVWEGLDAMPRDVPIRTLGSRASARPSLTAAERADVFWELCGPAWTVAWAGRREAERNAAAGRRQSRGWDMSVPQGKALDSLWERRQGAPRFIRLRILSAVFHWRAMTTEQIASLVGTRAIEGDLRVFWQAGLVQHGTLVYTRTGQEGPAPDLRRICGE